MCVMPAETWPVCLPGLVNCLFHLNILQGQWSVYTVTPMYFSEGIAYPHHNVYQCSVVEVYAVYMLG